MICVMSLTTLVSSVMNCIESLFLHSSFFVQYLSFNDSVSQESCNLFQEVMMQMENSLQSHNKKLLECGR